MKVALVLTNLAGGGAEAAMLRLATALGRRGHAVTLLLLENRIDHALPGGVELVKLSERRISGGWLGKWASARRLRAALLRLGRVDLTVSTLPFADEVTARVRAPNVWFRIANTLSAEVEKLGTGNPRKAARRLARYRSLYEGRNLVAVSDGVADDLRGALRLQRARIVRIYNGFDLDAIGRRAQDGAPGIPPEAFVLHVGRFMPQKRHDLLLDAWRIAALPHRLVLLTAPDERLEEMIRQRGLSGRVTVAGFQPNPYPWMRAAELVVLSSDREGMPNVLVEAVASGTRVVSTDCPSGPREVLRGELARGLVPPGDAVALAGAMHAALTTPWPRPSAADVPEAFTEPAMAAAYERLAEAA
jgi:glycosyltransferase involved in cell wall biosynthesis